MSYQDKMLATKPQEAPAGPFDTASHGAPDPAWSLDKQLAWFSTYSHILLLNSSERLRRSAAAQADKRVSALT
jgi:hypothetical protein